MFNAFLAQSGMFTCNFQTQTLPYQVTKPPNNEEGSPESAQVVFNPYPPEVSRQLVDVAPSDKQTMFLEEYQRTHKHKLFDRSDFEDYALTLLAELVPNLIEQNHDVILFPLRGCRQPGIVTKVVAGIPPESVVIFNYTYATVGSQQEVIRSQLIEQLQQRLPNREIVNLGIVDTAKGGNGSIHLASVLADIQEEHFAGQKWSVQFHLLHARDKTLDLSSKSYLIPDAKTDSVFFLWPRLYAVEDLLVEDWDDGIGISTYRDGETIELKKAETPGRIIVRDATGVSLIESPNLSDLVTSLMVESVNDLMLNDPAVKYVRDVLENDSRTNQ